MNGNELARVQSDKTPSSGSSLLYKASFSDGSEWTHGDAEQLRDTVRRQRARGAWLTEVECVVRGIERHKISTLLVEAMCNGN